MSDLSSPVRRTLETTTSPQTTYRAIIRDPEKLVPKDDGHGTMTVAGVQVNYAMSLVQLRAWADKVLKTSSTKSWCEIYRLEEELVERIDKS